jgi:hypothetical protein
LISPKGIDEKSEGIKGQFSDDSGFEPPKGLGSGMVDLEVIKKAVYGFDLFSKLG